MEMQQPSSTGGSRTEALRAYDLIRQRITTLELAPGAPIHEPQLAAGLGGLYSSVKVKELLRRALYLEIGPPAGGRAASSMAIR